MEHTNEQRRHAEMQRQFQAEARGFEYNREFINALNGVW